MGSTEQILRDELRAAHRREEALQRQVDDLLNRIMYLTGKPYVPTPLELADEEQRGPRVHPEDAENDDLEPGYTDDAAVIPL